MVDITHKSNTLRIAKAQAIVEVSMAETIAAIEQGTVPKGDVFAMSKAAGLLGVKKTPELLPDCHPMPIEYTGIDYEIDGLQIKITIVVKTIYKTGVEVEAMHGASVVALNMYDMLKPIDKGVSIKEIKLLEKKGGKSSFKAPQTHQLKACVIVCSDSISNGIGEDRSGEAIREKLTGYEIEVLDKKIIPDDKEAIVSAVTSATAQADFVVITGGTGCSPRDVTPEALAPMLQKRLMGVEETIRKYGQERMPYAMLSRSVVGIVDQSLVMALPGSVAGVRESLDAVTPHIFHIFSILKGEKH